MTRNKRLALAFYLGAALAGAAVGAAVDHVVFRPPRWWDQKEMRTRFYDKLHLTSEQRDSANRIFDERNRIRDSLFAPIKAATDSVSAAARARFSRVLSPDQVKTYERLRQERALRDRPK